MAKANKNMCRTARLGRIASAFATRFLLATVLSMPLALALGADQRWAATYDSGRSDQPAASVTLDASGNAYVAGSTYDGTHSHYKVVKYDSAGNSLWNTTASSGISNDDLARASAMDSTATHLWVTGSSSSNVGWTALLDASSASTPNPTCAAALTTAGIESEAVNVVVDSAGNAYVTGRSRNASGDWDFRTVKYSGADCVELWAATYDSGGDDTPVGVGRDSSGNTYVAGYSSGVVNGFTIAKYDASGNQSWVANYPGTGVAAAMVVDSAGNVYVTGRTGGAGTTNFLTAKYDAAGTLGWAKTWDNGSNDAASAVTLDGSGNVYVAGRSYRSTTSTKDDDYAVVKYDSATGAQLWAHTYDGGNGYDEATSLVISSDNKLYVSGRSANGSGTWDYVTLKYTLNGDLTSTINRYSTNNDTALTPASALTAPAFAVIPGYVYLAGEYFNAANEDFALVKHGIDTDDDGLVDDVETNTGTYVSPENTGSNPNNPDTDGDGLSDGYEVNVSHTDPNNADTDGDGLTDGYEVNVSHSDPNKADTDGDGLTDGYEVNVSHTDPNNADTDGDGAKDGYEVSQGTNPNDPISIPPTDLYISAISVVGDAVAGSSVTINFTVTNQGQSTVSGFNIAFYLSPDNTLNSSDYLCTYAQVAMTAGSVPGSVSCTIPSTTAPGWNYIGATADDNHPGSSITEGDEGNNTLISQVNVQGGVDTGDGHDAIAGAARLKDLGDGHNAINTSTWPLLKDLGDGTDGALNVPAGTVTSTTLKKTGTSSGWNAGAISSQTLSGDGAVEFTAVETNKARMFGLGNTNPDANYTSINYAVNLSSGGAIAVYENGTSMGTFGSYAANDLFRIERTGSTVAYKKNGTTFYTSTVAASGSYFVDTSFNTSGGTIKDAKIIDGSGTNLVVWTSLTTGSSYGVTVTDTGTGTTFNLMTDSSDALGNAGDGNPGQPDGFATGVAADVASGATTIAVGSTAGFVTGDEVLIIQMQSATSGGKYEFEKNVTVVDGTTLSFPGGLINAYYATGGKAQVVRVPNYTNATVGLFSTATTSAYDAGTGTGGILAFRANGAVTLDGAIDASGKGFAGGAGGATTDSYQGDSSLGAGAANIKTPNGGGGGGSTNSNSSGGGGGGYGAAGTSVSAASGGLAVGDATLGVLLAGGGGGSGDTSGGTSGSGGNGGGIVFITADALTVNATGGISNDGAGGGTGTGAGSGGGGGAGGSLYLGANSLTLGSAQVTANGGSKGTGYTAGGAGGIGRIYLEGTVSGTTTPSAVTGSGAQINGYPTGVINAYAPLTTDVSAGATSLIIGAVSGAGSFASGDEILIIQMQSATNAGRYEFKKNITVSGSTISFPGSPLGNGYYGASGKAQVVRVPNYSNFNVASGDALTAPAYSSTTGVGGILIFRANGAVTIDGAIDMSGIGFAGGNPGANTTDSKQGDGYLGAGALNSTAANGNGGGANTSGSSGVAGGGGNATAGASFAGSGTGGEAVGGPTLDMLFLGGGGGSGDSINTSYTPGAGGNGGGIVFVTADTLTVTGSIASDGIDGAAGVGAGASKGGGGAGGSIYLGANSLTLGTNLVTAAAGIGYSVSYKGSVGRIYLEGTVSGSTSPTAVTGSGATNNVYPSGVINAYAPLTVDVAAGATSLSIGAVSGAGSFANGDEILIIQMQHQGATEFFNDLSKPSGTAGYNAGAISTQTLSADGAVEFTAASGYERVFGLASPGSSPGISYTSANYKYAIRLYGTGSFDIYEGGVLRYSTSYAASDVFRIERSNCAATCTVTYYRNGTAFRTVTGPNSALMVDTSLYSVSASAQITEAKIISGADTHAVTWTSVTNVSVSSTVANPVGTTTNAGKYEFKKNISVSGSTISFATGLANTYYGGANGKTQIVRVPNYADFTISSTVTAPAYDSSTGTGGVVAFRATGTVTVNGVIDVSGLGFSGGNPGSSTTDSKQGDGQLGTGALNVTDANGNGGGASIDYRQGGGGGGYAAAGTAGGGFFAAAAEGGAELGDASLSLLFPGGGGGSGDVSPSGTPDVGGNGGGIVFVAADTLTLGATGAIASNGGNGAAGAGNGAGGGAGGSLYLAANTASVAGSQLMVTGGAGGASGGGAGAAGRVYLQAYNNTGVALPDLVMSAVSVPASAVNGSTIIIDNTVMNQKSTAAGPFRVAFYLSTDPYITVSDTFLGSRTVTSLLGGASDSDNTDVTLPAGISGNYYIGAIVDDEGAVVEAREDNNATVATIAGDPTGTTVSVTTGTADKPQSGGGGGSVREGDLIVLIAFGLVLGCVRRREAGRRMEPVRIVIVFALAIVADAAPSSVWAGGGLQFNFEQQGPASYAENTFSSCGPGMSNINCDAANAGGVQAASSTDNSTSFLRELINGWWHVVVIDSSGGFRQETYIKAQAAVSAINAQYSESGGGTASFSSSTDAFTNSNGNPYQVSGSQDNYQLTGSGTGNPNVVAMRQEVQTSDTTSVFQKGAEGLPLDYNDTALQDSLAQKPVIGQTVNLSDAQATGSMTFLLDMRNSHYNQGGIAGNLTNRSEFSGASLPDGGFVWDQAVNAQSSNVTGGQYTYTPGVGWGSSIVYGQDFQEGSYSYSDGSFNLHDDWTPFCNPASECQ